VIAQALTSDVCSRINVALRVAIAGGQLSDFAYPLYICFDSVSVIRPTKLSNSSVIQAVQF